MEQIIDMEGKRYLTGYNMARAALARQGELKKGKLSLRLHDAQFIDTNFLHGLLENWFALYDDHRECLGDLRYSLCDNHRAALMAALRRSFSQSTAVATDTLEKYVSQQRLKERARKNQCKQFSKQSRWR